ncbi:MAG: aspartate-semialdehyde dehydrogenase, partial [Chloroflexota bacterium]
MRELEVAVVGATGLVGQEMVRVLQQRHFPLASLHLFASDRSAGKKLYFDHNEIEVQELTPKSFERIQLALFSAGAEVSRSFAPVAMKTGTIVIDNSAAYRMEPWVPLVVPEVNAADLQSHKGLVANPNCSTIEMVVALNPLHQVNPIKRIIVATYQSVSGTGAAAMEELTVQTRH